MYFNTSRKIILSSVLGNALETYDFMVWKLFLVFLCKEFLPPESAVSDMLFLLLIPYIVDPFAGLLGGMLADKIGRKSFLTKSIFLMGISTALVTVLPSYHQVGMLAVFLLLAVKILQIFAGASEYVNSVSLLIESCDRNQRGYFGTWADVGVNAGTLLASLVGALVLYLIDAQILPAWGWRLVFISALINMAVGIQVRRSIPESREFVLEYGKNGGRSFHAIWTETVSALKERPFKSFLVFSLALFAITIDTPMFVYFPMYLVTFNNVSSTQAFLINSCALAIYTMLIPLMGSLSDRYGRPQVLLTGSIASLLLVTPYFACLKSGNLSQILWFHCLMAIPCSAIFGSVSVFITEIFPLSVRCSAVNLLCSLAGCLGGGVIPLVTTKLMEQGDYSPSPIIIAFGLMSTAALCVYLNGQRSAARINKFIPQYE